MSAVRQGTAGIHVIASLARLALDDPAGCPGLPEGVTATSVILRGPAFAVQRLDEIINLLNPSEWTREGLADAIRVLALHVEQVEAALAAFAALEEDERLGNVQMHLTIAVDQLDLAHKRIANPE